VLLVAASFVVGFIVCAGLAVLFGWPLDGVFFQLLLISWIVVAVLLLATQKWKR
jgi:hypothetical protein